MTYLLPAPQAIADCVWRAGRCSLFLVSVDCPSPVLARHAAVAASPAGNSLASSSSHNYSTCGRKTGGVHQLHWSSIPDRVLAHPIDDGPAWPAYCAPQVNWCWDARLRWTNFTEAHKRPGEGHPVTTWLNMVQTSTHLWGFCFFFSSFWNVQKIVGDRIYVTTKGHYLSDLISTWFSIWHTYKLFTFIELWYVSDFRWACLFSQPHELVSQVASKQCKVVLRKKKQCKIVQYFSSQTESELLVVTLIK
jgi:hypothetical protein